MSAMPLAIGSYGLVTGVGLDAPSTCAAIRCAIDSFQESRFMDSGGEWILASEVPLEKPWRGKTKLIKMAAMAVRECLQYTKDIIPQDTPMLLCLAEPERKGRVIDDDNQFFLDLEKELEMQFHRSSRVIVNGHVSVAVAMRHARKLIYDLEVEQVLIVATDSLLVGATLAHYEEHERLLTSNNSNGFIAGEAGAAFVVERFKAGKAQLVFLGLGFGVEKAHVYSEEPCRADGLTGAIMESLGDAGCEMSDLDFRITDISGEQYYFKEAALVLLRLLRTRKATFDMWHPADCIGEVGCVQAAVMLIVIKAACEKDYCEGSNILVQLGDDSGKRAAMILSRQGGAQNG